MKTKEFSSKVRVYIEDTDAGGVVYYVNYLKFMERARSDYLRALGFAKPALITDDLLLVVASANVDYKRSAKLDDELKVSAKVEKIAKSYVVFSQVISRSKEGESTDKTSSEVLASGTIKVACVHKETMRPIAMPHALRETLIKDQGE